MQALGIGNFWFPLKGFDLDKLDENFSPKQHVDAIRQSLEAIDNVSDVEVHLPERNISSYQSFGETKFPRYASGFIEFSVFIPKKVQDALNRASGETGSESFHVLILCGYHESVTYIGYPTSSLDVDPSSAVVVVREYLKEKLAGNEKIELDFIGPSPFHADFILDFDENQSTPALIDRTDINGGYRKFTFLCGRGHEDSLVRAFISRYNDDLETFYTITRYRSMLIDSNIKIRSIVSHLTSDYKVLERIKNTWKMGTKSKLVAEVYRELLIEKSLRVELKSLLMEKRNSKVLNPRSDLYYAIKAVNDDISETPTDEIKQLMAVIEDRRQKRFGNISTVVAALLGGCIGAFMSYILTGFSTQKSQVYLLPMTDAIIHDVNRGLEGPKIPDLTK